MINKSLSSATNIIKTYAQLTKIFREQLACIYSTYK